MYVCVCVHVCACVYLSVCLPASLSVCLPVWDSEVINRLYSFTTNRFHNLQCGVDYAVNNTLWTVLGWWTGGGRGRGRDIYCWRSFLHWDTSVATNTPVCLSVCLSLSTPNMLFIKELRRRKTTRFTRQTARKTKREREREGKRKEERDTEREDQKVKRRWKRERVWGNYAGQSPHRHIG